MKKSDLMRSLVGSKNLTQKDIEIIDNFFKEEKSIIDNYEEINPEEPKIEENSGIIQLIKKRIVKVRN